MPGSIKARAGDSPAKPKRHRRHPWEARPCVRRRPGVGSPRPEITRRRPPRAGMARREMFHNTGPRAVAGPLGKGDLVPRIRAPTAYECDAGAATPARLGSGRRKSIACKAVRVADAAGVPAERHDAAQPGHTGCPWRSRVMATLTAVLVSTSRLVAGGSRWNGSGGRGWSRRLSCGPNYLCRRLRFCRFHQSPGNCHHWNTEERGSDPRRVEV